MNNYFIYFDVTKKIDYNLLLDMYDLADFNKEEQCFNLIKYYSLQDLSDQLNISNSKLRRVLEHSDYKEFFVVDKKNRTIKLLNCFRRTDTDKRPFIILTKQERTILKLYSDNNLYRYFIYIKYFCGLSKSQDFTSKQYLSFCGLSTKSNKTLSDLSSFNKILVEHNLISIEKKRDNRGFVRNVFSVRTLLLNSTENS